MKVVISSGHGKFVRGAAGYIDEVDEARRVVESTATALRAVGVETTTFHDDVSHSQNENLNRIVDFHNSKSRDLDVSVHFNAYQSTSKPMGSEVLYVTQNTLADTVVDKICEASGLINRGPKKRTDLFFLNNTAKPAILIEVCFVDSKGDVDIYHAHYQDICNAISEGISGKAGGSGTPPSTPNRDELIVSMAMESLVAKYSWKDRGVAPAGYIQGFALTWAKVVERFQKDDPAVLEMAKANTHNDSVDALSWFNSDFQKIGMSNEADGINTLRHLFVLLMGLGMRESSGKHCVGRDQSASNVSADTAEAGLYQTSYNAHSCSPEFDKLMDNYAESPEYPCYLDNFKKGVSCSASDWKDYGSGRGAEFQALCKECPAFAIESCALVLRNLRQHYGPINRKEAELRPEADWLLENIQRVITNVS